jgi:apolipoprotein D and lipocalin family protein
MSTVSTVTLEQYTGTWYEIAKIPNRFQDHCATNTRAEYTLMDNGRLEVINSCVDKQGRLDQAQGIARIVDPATNAKLKVSFVQLFGFSLFWGDYWIIGLAPDYSYAVIGTPDRRFGWILSRTPDLPEQATETAYAILRKNGYDTSAFKPSAQDWSS